jgi:iron(III) transport system substrate-binding protein
MDERARFTRRDLLRYSGLTVGGIAIAACAPAAAPSASLAPTAAAASAAASSAAVAGTIDVLAPTTPKVATLEQELAIPAALLDAAKKEGRFTFVSSIDKGVATKVLEVFKKRYPGIEPVYQEGSEEVRTIRTLTEFKAGRNKTDVVMGIGGFLGEYKDAKALTSLTDLPVYPNFEPPFRDSEGQWVGVRIQFWGMGFNTDRVKPSELPKTWEDLADPKWNGRLGLGDRPQLWAQQLWKGYGADRTTALLTKLFANSPQRRKEGLDASAQLLGAGEFDAYLPAAPYRIQQVKQSGAPVLWDSPDPLTVAVSELVVVQGSPSPNAARVFVNWFLSREGQDTYSRADITVPTHPALRSQKDYLGIFADRMTRPALVRQPEDEQKILPQVRTVWNKLWTGG